MADIYIKDLIQLPQQVNRGDFVLRLAEGITEPERTITDYVVTPQLRTTSGLSNLKCYFRNLICEIYPTRAPIPGRRCRKALPGTGPYRAPAGR